MELCETCGVSEPHLLSLKRGQRLLAGTLCSVQRVNSVFVCVSGPGRLDFCEMGVVFIPLFYFPFLSVIAKALSFVIAHAICWMGLLCLLHSSHYICYLCSISHQGWVGRLLSKCNFLVTSYLLNCNQQCNLITLSYFFDYFPLRRH